MMKQIEKWMGLAMLAATIGCGEGASATDEIDPREATYYRDIKPLVDKSCTSCHREGGLAAFSLTSFEEVSAVLPAVREAVATRRMPPSPADVACADYSNSPALEQKEIDLLTGWIDAGARAGEHVAEKETEAKQGEGLTRVDFTLDMPEAYTPVQSPDDYRCFLVDWPADKIQYVTGFQFHPGDAATVHHVIAYLIPPNQIAKYDALDAADPAAGYTCFGGPGGGIDLDTRFIGSWAPGSKGGNLPEGTGLKIAPGSKIALQVHYNTTTAAPAPDRTSMDLMVADDVEREGTWQFFTNLSWIYGDGMEIPAMKSGVVHAYSIDPTPLVSSGNDFVIQQVGLHMHTFGRKAKLGIHRKDAAEECLLSIPSWDFHWQLTYELADETIFHPGDELTISCEWDNTTPEDLKWGEGTGDEMCLGLVYYTMPRR